MAGDVTTGWTARGGLADELERTARHLRSLASGRGDTHVRRIYAGACAGDAALRERLAGLAAQVGTLARELGE